MTSRTLCAVLAAGALFPVGRAAAQPAPTPPTPAAKSAAMPPTAKPATKPVDIPPPASYPVRIDYAARPAVLLADFGTTNDRAGTFAADGVGVRVKPAVAAAHQPGADSYWFRDSRYSLAGDFEASLTYDIAALGPPGPAGTAGPGFGLTLEMDAPLEAVTLKREVSKAGKPQFAVVRRSRTKAGPVYEVAPFPSSGVPAGRLVVRRTGAWLILSAADGARAEPEELTRFPFPPGQVPRLRLMADQGGTPTAPLDVRFTALTVRAGKLADNVGTAPATVRPVTPAVTLLPATLLGSGTVYGGAVPGRLVARAGDGESLTFHINPAKTADGKVATSLDQRRSHFGLSLGQTLVGDFQYEATVEFLTLPDKAPDGWGVCVGLGVNGPPAAGNAGINRGIFGLTGPSYHICRDIPNGSAMTYAYDNLPSKSKHVRLGIRRQGTEAILLAAEGPTEPLVETRRYSFTDLPVQNFAIYATTGGGDYPLSARVSDVKLLTGSALPPAPAKSRTPSVVMVPPVAPVPPTTSAGELTTHFVPTATPVRGGGWGLPLGAGLAGLLIGTLLGRRWGSRTASGDDE